MTIEKQKDLIKLGFDEAWFEKLNREFKPEEKGKYKIHIFFCEDLDQEPDTGIFIASYFFSDEKGLSNIHRFFEGLFYVMNVVETGEELGRGIIDGAPFDEMAEFEGKPWNWLDYQEVIPSKNIDMLSIVKEILFLSEEFVKQVEMLGNECAWTDRKVEQILAAANRLQREYDKI